MKRIVAAAIMLVALTSFGAGCRELPPTQQIADTLAPTDSGRAAVAQDVGFGNLPTMTGPEAENNTRHGVVRINAELPSLQPTVTVVRVPAGTADRTQFGNLSTAMGLPAGALGDNPQNLSLDFTWTNNEGYLWSYRAANSQIAFSNPLLLTKENSETGGWNAEKIIRAARDFAVGHGFEESDFRNFALASSTETNGTVAVSAERVVDERNIVNKDGRPELGGVLYVNPNNGLVVSGWLVTAQDAQRSNYPAISAAEMKAAMEQGGLAGSPTGNVDLDKVFFAFVKLPRQGGHEAEFLAPALVGEGTEALVEGGSRPYRIVVPLIKQ